jgi:putative spermidine/putrescine transport system ATP-binding protein
MLRILAGLETPNPGGKVFFGTEDVTEVPIEKRNVGMVFQNYALFPNMNVAQNIAYGLKVRGDRGEAKQNRVSEMLDMMQIRELMHRRINQLSGGQKQRVALARAIAVRPRVLLMDEPLTALDAKLRDSLRVEIDSLLRSLGITAVYVTHDQAEAMALGDRIVVMEIGRVAQIGTPREIYFEPKSRFVAEFIGNINRIECMVRKGKLEFPGGRIPLKDAPGVQATENQIAEVFFRPEHAKVVEAGQGHFTAKVVASFFMGDRTRLIINGSAIENLTIEAMGQQSFIKGQPIDIKIDPSALLTLKE